MLALRCKRNCHGSSSFPLSSRLRERKPPQNLQIENYIAEAGTRQRARGNKKDGKVGSLVSSRNHPFSSFIVSSVLGRGQCFFRFLFLTNWYPFCVDERRRGERFTVAERAVIRGYLSLALRKFLLHPLEHLSYFRSPVPAGPVLTRFLHPPS